MSIAVCFNLAPPRPLRGEATDLISEAGAAEEARAVAGVLEELGYQVALIPLEASIPEFIARLQALRPEMVFNLCEGSWGDSSREMHIAALFDLLRLPHSGSPALTLGLTQDKALTKNILVSHGLATPAYLQLRLGEALPEELELAWPMIVKPCREDASLGITRDSIVRDEIALASRVHYIHEHYHQPALIEEFIDGREFNAAVLGDHYLQALPLSEICFEPGLDCRIVSYAGKWQEGSKEFTSTQPVCPAVLSQQQQQSVQQIALRACALLGCRDYARVDIRLRDETPFILEVNANPDISPTAGLARAARADGMDYPALIERIVLATLQRKEDVRA